MSPISEESAKALTENLLILLAQSNQQRMQLAALEAALKKEAPGTYEEYREILARLREQNDAAQYLVTMEKLKALLEK
jgi:hypothetical protein